MVTLREFFADFTEDKWVQGKSAVDGEGLATQPWANEACKWCLTGWVDKEYAYDRVSPVDLANIRTALSTACRIKYNDLVITVNDTANNFATVRQAIEAAAELHDDGKIFPS